jgi:hypothetical protein
MNRRQLTQHGLDLRQLQSHDICQQPIALEVRPIRWIGMPFKMHGDSRCEIADH